MGPLGRTARRPDGTVTVVLVDQDPISRHVLGGMLEQCTRIKIMISNPGEQPLDTLDTRGADVAVLAPSSLVDMPAMVRVLISRRVKVLALGTRWTGSCLDRALGAGVSGCLVKDALAMHLPSAVLAVAAGHLVLTPQLAALRESAVPGRRRIGRGAPPDERLSRLTDREREVLHLLGENYSTADTAASLGVSPATVKSHVSHALTKMGARSRLEAILMIRGEFGGEEAYAYS
jgi:DNA-binding NarL/FixJ family response regulator